MKQLYPNASLSKCLILLTCVFACIVLSAHRPTTAERNSATTMVMIADKSQGRAFDDDSVNSECEAEEYCIVDSTMNGYTDGEELGPSSYCDEVNLSVTTSSMVVAPCGGGSDEIGGTVFQDYNNDGVNDSGEIGVEDIQVRVFDSSGNEVGSPTTDANGDWNLTGLNNGDQYRVEFSIPSSLDYLQPSGEGSDNNSNTQFVTPSDCNVNFGVIDIQDYCHTTNPYLITPCYVNGSGSTTDALEDPGIISFRYNDSGDASDPGNGYTIISRDDQIGSVWGVAYDAVNERLFTSTFLKRHVGMQIDPGHIFYYDFDPSAGTTTNSVPTSYNLQGVTPANGGSSIDLGSVTRSSTDPPASPTAGSTDIDAFAKVGRMSFGDMDVDLQNDLLWIVNMNQSALISIDISGSSFPGEINQYPISTTINCGGSSVGTLRFWGLGFNNGVGYVGGVCDASGTNNSSNLSAWIFSFDPNNPSATMSIEANLSITSPLRQDVVTDWEAWADTWSEVLGGHDPPGNSASQTAEAAHPQPIIGDIAFDENDNIIVAVMDRYGHQMGPGNANPVMGSSLDMSHNRFAWPDIYQVSFPMGSADPDAEFFNDRNGGASFEGSGGAGGLVVIKGTNEIASIVVDPLPPASSPATQFTNSGGVHWWDSGSGDQTDWYELYQSDNATPPLFAKAQGLGDLEATCEPLPIEIGNYVWIDTDEDGVQDADESGLDGLTVSIYESGNLGTLVDQTTTSSGGKYLFTDLKRNTDYVITFGDESSSTATVGGIIYDLTTALIGEGANSSFNDSDGALFNFSGTMVPAITYTTGKTTNHTLDIGFVDCTPSATVTPTSGNCVGGVVTDNATIDITSIIEGDIVGISTGSGTIYVGPDYNADPTTDPDLYDGTSGSVTITGLVNNTEYVVRVFNMKNDCFMDYAVTTPTLTLPSVTLTDPSNVCVNAGVQTGLGGGSPAQGTEAGDMGEYSGTGVTDDGNGTSYSFNPATAGAGTHTITYTYTDGNGCVNSATQDILVENQSEAGTAEPALTICETSTTSINLFDRITGEDSGGVWSAGGSNPSGGTFDAGAGSFDPTGAGTGDYTFTYSFAAGSICAADDVTITITVEEQAEVGSQSAPTETCQIDDTQFTLIDLLDTGTTPSGGTWTASGSNPDNSGVTPAPFDAAAGTFDTDGVAAGTYVFTYTVVATAPCVDVMADVTIIVNGLDYGDLPDGTIAGTPDYATQLADSGPHHCVPDTPELFIGTSVDTEADGQPDADPTNAGDGADEDGVDFMNVNVSTGNVIEIPVVVTNTTGSNANFYAFIDWNKDGNFDDLGEAVVVNSIPSVAGSQTILVEFTVPTEAQGAVVNTSTGARFRLTTENLTGNRWEGPANDGEVEDYFITISCPSGNCFEVQITSHNN